MSHLNPYTTPVSDAPLRLPKSDDINLAKLGWRQRRLNLSIVAYLACLPVVIPCIIFYEGNVWVMILCGVVCNSILIYACFCAYKLTRFFYNKTCSWLLVLTMFFPVLGLIFILLINQRASTILKQSGYTVGFLGCKN